LRARRGGLRARLRAVVSRAELRDAVFVASPDLDEGFDHWARAPEGDRGQKVERALVRYFQRMAGRATPFGLCSGCSVGTLDGETRLILAERACYRRHTRLDMDYLVTLAERLGRDPALRPGLSYRTNTSLYRAAGRRRFTEVQRTAKEAVYRLVGIEDSDYLAAVLERARHGAHPAALAAALVEAEPGASLEEADEYIGELINQQVLVPDLLPAVT